MRQYVQAALVAAVLAGSTLTASATVTGSDPRPAVVRSNTVTGSDPRPAAAQPVSMWTMILSFFGISSQ